MDGERARVPARRWQSLPSSPPSLWSLSLVSLSGKLGLSSGLFGVGFLNMSFSVVHRCDHHRPCRQRGNEERGREQRTRTRAWVVRGTGRGGRLAAVWRGREGEGGWEGQVRAARVAAQHRSVLFMRDQGTLKLSCDRHRRSRAAAWERIGGAGDWGRHGGGRAGGNGRAGGRGIETCMGSPRVVESPPPSAS